MASGGRELPPPRRLLWKCNPHINGLLAASGDRLQRQEKTNAQTRQVCPSALMSRLVSLPQAGEQSGHGSFPLQRLWEGVYQKTEDESRRVHTSRLTSSILQVKAHFHQF